jgi:hypothetical protein
MSVIPAFGRLKQEDCKFEAIPAIRATPCQKERKEGRRKRIKRGKGGREGEREESR